MPEATPVKQITISCPKRPTLYVGVYYDPTFAFGGRWRCTLPCATEEEASKFTTRSSYAHDAPFGGTVVAIPGEE